MPFPDGARPIVVVGDRFSAFARAVGAWTVSDLVRALENGEGPERIVPLEIRFGQGVGAYEAGYLRDVLVRHGYAAGEAAVPSGDAGLVGRRQVHKTRAARLRLTMNHADLRDPSRLAFRATVELEQAGRPAATGRIDYTAFERTRIAGRERRRAEHALRTCAEIAEAAEAVGAVETAEAVEAVEGAGAAETAETAETVETAETAPPDAARP